ncbi:NADP-dependent oxidoreductase [Saccharibacillus endophyticus]|uniref:NADP-dependent oxidoreductase YfmJ n=1 Tax=Saccharibacillus endophyticus TaxID=2060666 RepID=A0ABQ1ZYQ1_9BACL|nr:NADP-dependent oxidoreductase [Saccharibacillus endophyticus]GGH81983.1 putative NADP-dependent oxidoreductase YfmJ [Saccharibacillus endophyticus]
MTQKKRFVLASRPEGMPTQDNFELKTEELEAPQDGEISVETLYLSVDPYMRGRMNDAKSYSKPYEIGGTLGGGSIGRVIESRHASRKVGDIVLGGWGWQTHATVSGDQVAPVDPDLAPIQTALGVLGMTGLTAYFGLLDIGQPKAGETVVVSGAGGAVGMIVGQIAKIKGARVVGISGSEEKNRYLSEELGFDAVVNYKTESLGEALAAACPDGVDVYFDNVGGEVTDAVFELLNSNARIPLCGQISLYNVAKKEPGPRFLPQLLTRTALVKGFLVGQYQDRYSEAIPEMAGWLKEGKLKYRENIIEGFERTPEAFLGLFSGDNLGKQLVKA